MKITKLGRTGPLVNLTSISSGSSANGATETPAPSGQVPTSSGSNTVAWGSNVAVITVNGTTQVLGPFVNFGAGSNTTVTVDMAGAFGSNTIRYHATGGAASFGSNATHVAEISAGGASTDSARMDHYHAGIGTITASSSNTLQRGTVNLRPGSNITFGLTDTDSDGELDTLTINGSAGGGGGGGSGGFDPWALPASPNASDEEGDAALSGWTNRNSASSEANVVSSIIRVSKTAAAFDDMVGADKAGTMGTDGDTWTIGIRDAKMDDNYAGVGLYVADSTPANVRLLAWQHDGTTGGSFQMVTYTGLSALSAQVNFYGIPLAAYFPSLPMFMRIVRNSSTSYSFQVSTSATRWTTTHSAWNPSFTVDRVGIAALSLTNTVDTEICVDFLRKNWTP